ncbi:MAG: hypothetical protein AAFY37_11665 [Pseudomonadota bacterium]
MFNTFQTPRPTSPAPIIRDEAQSVPAANETSFRSAFAHQPVVGDVMQQASQRPVLEARRRRRTRLANRY